MSEQGSVPDYIEMARSSLSDDDYSLEMDSYDGWVLEISRDDGEDVSLPVITAEENLSDFARYLASEVWGYDSSLTFAQEERIKDGLVEKGILDENRRLVEKIPLALNYIFVYGPDFQKGYSGKSFDSPEKEEKIARAVKDLDVNYAKSAVISEKIELSPNEVGAVLGYWEEEYGLDSDEFGSFNSSHEIWKISMLENDGETEDSVIDDVLEP